MTVPSPPSPEEPPNPAEPGRQSAAARSEAAETDLWDLDTSTDLADEESQTATPDPEPDTGPPPTAEAPEPTQEKPRKRHVLKKSPPAKPAPSALGRDFDDLDGLDPLETVTEPPAASPADSWEPGPPAENEHSSASDPAKPDRPTEPADTEQITGPAPATDSVTLLTRPLRGLSSTEKIGLAALALILVTGIFLTLGHWLTRLPSGSAETRPDFPVAGESITALSATTYWRAPVTEGPEADRFRRGTQLLPVIDLSFRGGPAAVRVFFRNEQNQLVGDAITRPVSGETSLSVAATAGFEDMGMHAAYRTGENEPWTIEVFEGPSTEARSNEFKLLFKTPISSARRSSQGP
jgi:hypothetical protein